MRADNATIERLNLMGCNICDQGAEALAGPGPSIVVQACFWLSEFEVLVPPLSQVSSLLATSGNSHFVIMQYQTRFIQ
jgi:hypothetical protein